MQARARDTQVSRQLSSLISGKSNNTDKGSLFYIDVHFLVKIEVDRLDSVKVVY